jgi:predicted acetyltransferase
MESELRALTPDDVMAHRRLMSHAFNRGRVVQPPAEGDPPPKEHPRWGVFKGGELRAALTVEPYNVHWGEDATLALGGIAGVATWAEARGRGHVDALLREALRAMKDAGQVVSALYPFAWAFYRRYGWDWVGEKRRVKLPLRELKASPEGKRVASVPGGVQARERLQGAYSEFAQGYRGVFTAESHQWDYILKDTDDRTTYVYMYEPTGEYLLWRYERDGDKGIVREWTARTPEGHKALLSLLHYLGTQCASAQVSVPADSPLWSYVMHWDLETRASPVFMGRLVDLADAVAILPVPEGVKDGAMMLAVRDEHAPWNDGRWRVTSESGRARWEPVAGGGGGEAGVSLDIQALSQAFWGTPSLTALRAAGRVSVNDEDAFTLLAGLLPSAPVYTLDDF